MLGCNQTYIQPNANVVVMFSVSWVVPKDTYTNLLDYIYPHMDKMYVSAKLLTMNCLEACPFTLRGM